MVSVDNKVTDVTTRFIHDLTWRDIPPDVQHMAARCLLDLTATLVAGSVTEYSRIARDAAAAIYGGDDAILCCDGRRVSAAGAALANGMTIDAMDMHDGYRLTKGHAGVNVFPPALAAGDAAGWPGASFLTALVVGYEVALRAGVSLHQTACDYHTSGAWGALGAAAVTARALGLTADQTRHALGIAEYHGPRSPMMRCIDYPTMVKDGSGWGSMAGVVAAQLAARGFTGAPALTVEAPAIADHWRSLGSDWRMRGLYFKPYACCRWAQPAVEAARSLVGAGGVAPDGIHRIVVHTFEAAARLNVSRPRNTEQAQYSLPYPVAAVLTTGRLDPAQVLPPALSDEAILRLADRVEMLVDEELESRFPGQALARVDVHTVDGDILRSTVFGARGDPSNPLSDNELTDKFDRLTHPLLAEDRADALRAACWRCADLDDARALAALLAPPPEKIDASLSRTMQKE
jgi:2-methylcitrate dehydratase PrpD